MIHSRLHQILYRRLGRLTVDVPDGKHTATPMVSLADIKQVLTEELDEKTS